jgi:hypothetical protein
MGHFKKLFDNRFVGSWDLDERGEIKCKIDRVEIEEVQTQSGGKEEKPVLYFAKAKKGMVLNITNATKIAEKYGNDTDEWIGKEVTLYATTCMAFGSEVDCIRVK